VGAVTRLSKALLVAATCLLTAMGCASIGPHTIPRDRLDYAGDLGDSWKEQTLLNIVRLRYSDAPIFVDVSSVIGSYTLSAQVGATDTLFTHTMPNSRAFVGSGTYTDHPTISYTPLTGEHFGKSLLKPISPEAVFAMIQAGYPADFILKATTRAINGRYNRSGGADPRRADPKFDELIAAIRRIQRAEDLAMRIEHRHEEDVSLLFFRGQASAATEEDIATVVRLLGIKPPLGNITLTYGAVPRNDREIAVLTRSMLEILLEFASGIDVPAEDIASGRTYPGAMQQPDPTGVDAPLAIIHAGSSKPASTYAAVRYRGTWYWINDTDIRSKRAFTFTMMFFALAETGVTGQAPVITVDAAN
jgi:hypothetical protein